MSTLELADLRHILDAASSGDSGDDLKATYRVDLSAYARNGVWRLRVWDMSASRTGHLESWTLRL